MFKHKETVLTEGGSPSMYIAIVPASPVGMRNANLTLEQAIESLEKRVMAKDLFHDAVGHSLEKEQWVITADPLELDWDEVTVKIDLAAERLIAAERGTEKIAVEIKSFVGTSTIKFPLITIKPSVTCA